MAVILNSQPSDFSLAYNDNAYTFYSTNFTSTQRFKVLVAPTDWPTSDAFATLIVYPRVDTSGGSNKTFFDPSQILKSFLGSDIEIPSSNHSAFFPCNNSHKEYKLYVIEEDKNADGVYTLGDGLSSNVKSVFNGAYDLIDWVDFDYNLYVMGSSFSRFLTHAPRVQYINSDQSYFLHFIATSQANGREFTINVYDEFDNVTFTSQITNPNESFINSTYTYKYQRIAVGSYDISNINPSLSSTAGIGSALNGASYYTIQLTDSGNPKSELFTFKLNQECSKYTPVRVQFLNKLGGYDSFNFNYKSEIKTDVTRENYTKQHHVFTGSSWEYDKASRGNVVYDTITSKGVTINTGYLTDEQSIWMTEEFFVSPVMYIESNNELIAVNIDGRSITRQTSLNDKLIQYTFDLEYALTNIRQRG